MKRLSILLCLSALSVSAAPLALAAKGDGTLDQDYVTGYVGVFDILKTNQDAVQFGGEYRFRQWDFGVRPTLGVNADVNGGGYAYGGINWEVPLGSTPFLLVPNRCIYTIPGFTVPCDPALSSLFRRQLSGCRSVTLD